MADKDKHRVITIPTDNEMDSLLVENGVRAKNTDKSHSDPCKPFHGRGFASCLGVTTQISKYSKTDVLRARLNVGDRKISNPSIRKICLPKKITTYTGHKSIASLINYDTMDHKSASSINL